MGGGTVLPPLRPAAGGVFDLWGEGPESGGSSPSPPCRPPPPWGWQPFAPCFWTAGSTWRRPPPTIWATIFYLALGCTVAGYLLQNAALGPALPDGGPPPMHLPGDDRSLLLLPLRGAAVYRRSGRGGDHPGLRGGGDQNEGTGITALGPQLSCPFGGVLPSQKNHVPMYHRRGAVGKGRPFLCLHRYHRLTAAEVGVDVVGDEPDLIEDFHYLDLETRAKLAFDLKTFWDYNCKVIIIGVWTQTNLLTYMNPDLTGRIEEISIEWTDDELRQVIDNGSQALKIQIDDNIKNDMICDSFGNVGILQSLLLRLVEDEAGIEETQDFNTPIVNPVFYDNAAKGYANQLDGLYQQFAQTLSTGIRQRKKKSTGIYALSMEAIVNATDRQLMKGFSRNDIYTITNGKEPRIKKGNLKSVLKKLVELQRPETGRSLVISYDESIDSVFAFCN